MHILLFVLVCAVFLKYAYAHIMNSIIRSALSHDPALVPKMGIANRYAVTIRTVDNWMRRRVIPYQKIGGIVRFDISKVDAALARFEVK